MSEWIITLASVAVMLAGAWLVDRGTARRKAAAVRLHADHDLGGGGDSDRCDAAVEPDGGVRMSGGIAWCAVCEVRPASTWPPSWGGDGLCLVCYDDTVAEEEDFS